MHTVQNHILDYEESIESNASLKAAAEEAKAKTEWKRIGPGRKRKERDKDEVTAAGSVCPAGR